MSFTVSCTIGNVELPGRRHAQPVGDRRVLGDLDAVAPRRATASCRRRSRARRRRSRSRAAACLAAVAQPPIRPPPETGTTSASRSGTVLEQLDRARGLAGHDELVVEGRHEHARRVSRQICSAEIVAALARAVVEDDLGAVAARRVDLRLRRVVGMTTVARMPSSRETSATACAWFPEENATTASTFRRSVSALILL